GGRVDVGERLSLAAPTRDERREQRVAHGLAQDRGVLEAAGRLGQRLRQPADAAAFPLQLGQPGRVADRLGGERGGRVEARQPGGDQRADRQVRGGGPVEALYLQVRPGLP